MKVKELAYIHAEGYVIAIPESHELLMPLLAAIPLQLLAYLMGLLRALSRLCPTVVGGSVVPVVSVE